MNAWTRKARGGCGDGVRTWFSNLPMPSFFICSMRCRFCCWIHGVWDGAVEVSDGWQNLSVRVRCWIRCRGAVDGHRWGVTYPLELLHGGRRSNTRSLSNTPGVYSHAARSHVRAASLLVAGSFQRTALKISKSVDSSSSSLFSPPPPHSAARVPQPGSAATKWAASYGSSTRGSRPPTANPSRHPARASGRSRRPRGITRPRAPSRRPSR